jgi:hypothetical protein
MYGRIVRRRRRQRESTSARAVLRVATAPVFAAVHEAARLPTVGGWHHNLVQASLRAHPTPGAAWSERLKQSDAVDRAVSIARSRLMVSELMVAGGAVARCNLGNREEPCLRATVWARGVARGPGGEGSNTIHACITCG